jgi:hypothetical protein
MVMPSLPGSPFRRPGMTVEIQHHLCSHAIR